MAFTESDGYSISLEFVQGSLTRRARALAPTLEEYIASLLDAQVPRDVIREMLLGDVGERLIFQPIRKSFGIGAANGLERIRQSARDSIYAERLGKDALYAWTLGPVATEHCEDCLDRAARDPMTMEEWELIGLPKSGTTICNVRCNCDLTPVKK